MSGIAAMTGAIEMPSLQVPARPEERAGTGWLVAWLVLGVVGMVVQYSSDRSRR